MRSLLLAVALVATAAVPATAQEADCSVAPLAVEYEGVPLELCLDDGPVQFLVWELTVTTTTNLLGQSTDESVVLVQFTYDGQTFNDVDTLPPFPRVGPLANANAGDSFGLTELQ